jgi:hypothetical protein
MSFDEWLAAARHGHGTHIRNDRRAQLAFSRGMDPVEFAEIVAGGFLAEDGGVRIEWVRVDTGAYVARVNGKLTTWRASRNDNEGPNSPLQWTLSRSEAHMRPEYEAWSRKKLTEWLANHLRREIVGRDERSSVTEESRFAKRFRVGSRVTMNEDAIENYGARWQGVTLRVAHVSTSRADHPGFDPEGASALYDLEVADTHEPLPMALYDWELEPV